MARRLTVHRLKHISMLFKQTSWTSHRSSKIFSLNYSLFIFNATIVSWAIASRSGKTWRLQTIKMRESIRKRSEIFSPSDFTSSASLQSCCRARPPSITSCAYAWFRLQAKGLRRPKNPHVMGKGGKGVPRDWMHEKYAVMDSL